MSININDEKVINYLENKGELFKEGSWNIYYGGYLNYGELADHLASGTCKGVVKGENVKLVEEREGEFLGTFHGCEDVTMLTAQGYSCECGEYSGNLGYYIKGSFSDILLDILDVDINVSFARYH